MRLTEILSITYIIIFSPLFSIYINFIFFSKTLSIWVLDHETFGRSRLLRNIHLRDLYAVVSLELHGMPESNLTLCNKK